MEVVMIERGPRHHLSGNDTAASDLAPRQHALIAALLTAGDVTAACIEVGVARKTAYRWMAQPAFALALRDGERLAIQEVSRRLARLGARAVQTLEDTLSDPETPVAVRVRAADAVLSRLLQLRESVDFEERILAIEQALAQQEEHRDQRR